MVISITLMTCPFSFRRTAMRLPTDSPLNKSGLVSVNATVWPRSVLIFPLALVKSSSSSIPVTTEESFSVSSGDAATIVANERAPRSMASRRIIFAAIVPPSRAWHKLYRYFGTVGPGTVGPGVGGEGLGIGGEGLGRGSVGLGEGSGSWCVSTQSEIGFWRTNIDRTTSSIILCFMISPSRWRGCVLTHDGSMLLRQTSTYYASMLRSACSILLNRYAGSGGTLGTHPAINPPSMGRMLPVVQRDSSDAK